MKIKEILVESFKSPLFNLLAIANLILIAFSVSILPTEIALTPFSKLAISLNLPALVSTRILVSRPSDMFYFVPPLVYLQWIFIGALAKSIACFLKPKAV
ncbi:MAG: hypothetical protein IPM25_09600 [Chloracidobacterium sp.]|nr:hypothetical protein [Chloracidobacterium sp.]